MASFTKKNLGLARLVPILEIIGNEGIKARKRDHRCRSCYKVGHATKRYDTEHTLFVLPTGTHVFICNMCGAVSVYDDAVEAIQESKMKSWENGNVPYLKAIREASENNEKEILRS